MKKKKTELRKLIRYRKTLFSDSTLDSLSAGILKKIEDSACFQSAKTILLYFSMSDEVSTHAFIEKWRDLKTILLPVIVNDVLELRVYSGFNDLLTGPFGIQEPTGILFTDYDKIDLAIIPGMAFDANGNRLGRGKGYYDKLLPKLQAPKAGICYPFQMVDLIPIEDFDVKMDMVFF